MSLSLLVIGSPNILFVSECGDDLYAPAKGKTPEFEVDLVNLQERARHFMLPGREQFKWE
jgi:hypothetical protein